MTSTTAPDSIRAYLRSLASDASTEHGQVLDLRGLEAPEPMNRALLRASQLNVGESFVARTPRMPKLLLPRLDERGLVHVEETCADGSALIYIQRP